MFSPILFTFQIILLALGFGVGYWLLINAYSQEENDLKTIGKTLGWTLIIVSVILEILNFSYSIAILNKYSRTVYQPINNPSNNMPSYSRQDVTPQPDAMQENENIPQEPQTEVRPIRNHEQENLP